MKDSKRLNGKSKLIILGITIVIFLLTILFAMTNSKYDKGIIKLFDKQKDSVDFVITIRDSMDSSKLIANAKFAIWEMTIENDAYVFSPPYDADGNVLGTPEIIDGETVYTFESDENGQIITKLRNGIYKLEQISTIEGYDTLKNAIHFYFGVGEGLGALVELDANEPYLTGHTNSVTVTTEHCVEGRPDGSALYYNVGYLDYIELVDGRDVVVWEQESKTVYDIISDNEGFDVLTDTSIIRYDNSGNSSVITSVLSGAKRFEKDANGNFVVMGTYYKTITIDAANTVSGEEISITTSDGTGDLFVAIVTPEGLIESLYGIPGYYDEELSDMDILNNGDYVASYITDGGYSYEIVIIDAETQSYKNSVYVNTTGRTTVLVNDVIVGPNGGIYYSGAFKGSISFDAKETVNGEAIYVESYGDVDGVVIKYNKDLLVEWVTVIGGPGTDHFYKADLTADGGLLLAGDSDTGAFEIAGSLTQSGISIKTSPQWDNAGTWRGIAFKVNDDGEPVWGKELGYTSDEGMYAVTAFTNNSFAICGLETSDIVQSAFTRVNEDILMEEIVALESLTVENIPITYNVTTEVVNNVGGTISGYDTDVYEVVAWGTNSKEAIEINSETGYRIKKITVQKTDDDGNIQEEVITFNSTTTEYIFDRFIDVKEHIHIAVEFEEMKAIVQVNYYLEGTTTRVLSNDGTELGPDEYQGLTGIAYTVTPNSNIAEYYELVGIPENASGTYTDSLIEVNYYYRLKSYNYTVEYYFDGVKDDTLTYTDNEVHGTEINTYTNKVKVGYKLDRVETLPMTIGVNENILRVYYVIDEAQTKELSYIVEYYKDGVKVESDTEVEKVTVQILEPDTITVNKDKINITDKYEGYVFKGTEPENIPDTVVDGSIIKVNYEIRTDLSYTINYYEKETNIKLLDSDVIENLTFGEIVTENAIDIEGYNKENESETITIGITGNEINFYYTKRTDLSYRVEYYYNNVIDSEQTEIVDNQVFGAVISNYTDKVKNGYKLDRVETLPMTIGVNENVVKVYYVIDNNQTKELSYTVEYYKDGIKVDSDTEVEKVTVQVLEPDTITVNKDNINIIDKYEGYRLEKTEPESIPNSVTSGEVIKVYYVLDDGKTKELSYTVEYYKDGVLADTEVEKVTVQILEPDTITVNKDNINLTDKYEGYVFKGTEPENIPDTVVDGTVIKVNYEIRKDLTYTINYYEQGTNIKLLDSDVIENLTFGETVTENAIDIEGYNKVNDTETITIGITGNEINFYYTKRNDLSYRVEYYYNNVIDSEQTEIVDNQVFGTVISNYTDKEKNGYKLDKVETLPMTIGVNENVVKVYYVIDENQTKELSYTVEYYKDGVKVESDTEVEKVTVQILEPDTITVNKDNINIIDKYEGYRLEKTEPESIPNSVTSGDVIKVYYVLDDGNTKELSYTVEYYKDGVLADTEVEKVTVQILEPDTITVNKDNINLTDKYEGYVFKGTEPETIPDTVVNGSIIKVNYGIRNDLTYTINYYEQGTNIKLLESDIIENLTFGEVVIENAVEIEGYNKVNDTETITIKVTGNEINFYYTKRTDLSYTVRYLEQGTNQELSREKVVENQTFGESITETAIDIEGYNKVKNTETIEIKVTGNEINFYYTKRNDLSYRVEYYYDNVIDSEQTEIVDNQVYGTVIDKYTDKVKECYKLDKVETLPMTVGVTENVIKVYYVTDDAQTKELSYIVEYYKDGVLSDTEVEKVTVQILEPDTITVNKDNINIIDKYDGYVFKDTEPETIPDTVVNGTVIKVNYTRRSDLSYVVNYLEQGTNVKLKDSKTVNNKTFGESITENAIDIEGYNKVNETETIEIKVTGNEINFYYTKRNDLSYTVNYYENGTTNSLLTSKVVTNQLFGSNVREFAEEIEGYNKVDPTEKSITIGIKENVIDFYYTKRNDLEYVVKYLEQGTEKVLSEEKIVNNQTFMDSVTESAIEIEGYNKVNDTETIEIKVSGNEIVFYYIARADLSYTVRYLEQGTNQELSTEKVVENQTFGESITENAIDIEGYNKVNVTETIEIKVTGNEIIFYYTKMNGLSYSVNYYEENTTNKLANSKVVDGKVYGDTVTETAIDIEGYNKVNATETIEVKVSGNEINFYYTKRTDLSYTVRYLEEGTNQELSTEKVVENKTFGESITENAIDIEGYNKVNATETIEVKVTGNEIIFYYTKMNGLSYTVNYYEENTTNKLANSKVVDGKVYGDTVTETAIDIEGYNKVNATETIEVKVSGNEINFYYTKRTDLSYTVRYLEEGTNQELSTEKTVNNRTFGESITENAIDIEGYNKVNTEENITIKVTGNEINFYYTKRTDLSYTVKYLEQGTNIEVAENKTVTNQTFKAEISESAIEVEGYDKVNTEESIIVEVSGNEIIFYYTKRTDLSYTVKYLEQGTNIEVSENKTVTNQTFKAEISESAIEVEGYDKVNTEESIIVEVSGNEIIFYYTKRTDLSYTVKYLEQGTNIEVSENKTVTNQTFKAEISESAIEVEGYDKVNTEESIIVEVSGNEIIFYYTKRTDIKYTVEYYYNDVLDSSKTEEYEGTYLEEISNYISKVESGYKLGTEVNFPLIITTNESTNVIKINYVTDDSQTKELNYTVEYYKDGVKVESDTQIETEIVQLLAPEILTVRKDNINTTNKYVGYKLESTDPVIIPDTVANGEVIKVYYIKDNFDYIVEYYYENIIDPSKSVVTEATYQDVIDTYVDKVIPGYELDKVEGMPLTITENESTNVIKVYYKKARFEYTVEYYYDDVLKENYTETKEAIFEDRVETYTPKEDYGYKFDKVFNLPMRVTENVENNIIKVYYVRKDSTVSVQFVDKVSGNTISPEVVKEGKVFDTFDITNDVKEIEGYTLIESPKQLTGTFEEETQSFTYYYAKTSNVVVKYLENETNVELLPEENIVGYESKEYNTTRKDVANYTFVKDSGNTTGLMTDKTITVIYYYAQNTKVIVNHIDKNTGAILDQVVAPGKVGDEYESSAKDIVNYVLVESPVRETVIMTKDEIILEYYYAHVSAGVIEKHIDLRTGAVLDNKEYVGNEGDSYNTTSKTIQGYDLVTDMLPENASGTMTIDVIEVKYYYLRKTIVEVEYKDIVTGELISNNDGSESTEIIEGHQGDKYTTIEKAFNGYDIELEKYPSNNTGTMDVVLDEDGEISTITKVVYYYRYKTKVVENHIDIVTGDIIEVVEYLGHEEDLYQTNLKTFELFDLVEDKKPINDIGVMTKDIITVNYYYIQKTKVIVNYYDLATGKILKEIDETTKAEVDSTVVIEGHEGDEYEAKEKVFAGYDIVENMIPSNTKGVMTKGDITINYYYLYKTSVKVLYIEKANGNNITEYTLINGHEGDEFTISPKEITKYKLIESPKEEKGKMTKESKVFVYYYVRVSDGVKEQHIDLMTGNVIEEIIHQGNVGDSYDVQAKAIDGYDLVWEKLPTNSKGIMEDGLITVQYYHVKKADASGNTGGNGGTVSTPATGDSIVNGLIVVANIVLLVNVITLIKKKKHAKKQ